MNAMTKERAIRYEAKIDNFLQIPGSPIAYWASNQIYVIFKNSLLSKYAFSDGQILTGDNEKYIRFIWEVCADTISRNGNWMFHAKGGDFRKWYGNLDSVVAWDKKSIEHFKTDKIARFPKDNILFRSGITWNLISSYPILGVRFLPKTQTFNKAAAALLFYGDESILYTLGFVNSSVSTLLIRMINPTLNTNIKDVLSLPIIIDTNAKGHVEALVQENMNISQSDWDCFENSWDFKKHPLL